MLVLERIHYIWRSAMLHMPIFPWLSPISRFPSRPSLSVSVVIWWFRFHVSLPPGYLPIAILKLLAYTFSYTGKGFQRPCIFSLEICRRTTCGTDFRVMLDLDRLYIAPLCVFYISRWTRCVSNTAPPREALTNQAIKIQYFYWTYRELINNYWQTLHYVMCIHSVTRSHQYQSPVSPRWYFLINPRFSS